VPDEQAAALAELTAVLLAVTGEEAEWAQALTPASRLEADLRLDSLELATLGARLRTRYGHAVSLPDYLAGLDMDGLIGLTLGDLAVYLAERTGSAAAPGGAG
jgi:acyl carrier protein